MLHGQSTDGVPVAFEGDGAHHRVVRGAHRDMRGAHRLPVGRLGPATPVVATP